MKALYKYPQAEFPYAWLVEENRRRSRQRSGVRTAGHRRFRGDRYFDIFAEYAKAGARRHPDPDHGRRIADRKPPRCICCRRSGFATRGPGAGPAKDTGPSRKIIAQRRDTASMPSTRRWGSISSNSTPAPKLLFTENETNFERLFGLRNASPYVKDSFHDYVIHGRREAVNPHSVGTKAAALLQARYWQRRSRTVNLRLRTLPRRHEEHAESAPTHCSSSGSRRPMSSTASCWRPRMPRALSHARHTQGCCGPSSFTTTQCRTGWRAIRRSRRRPPAGRMAATHDWTPSLQSRRDLHARQLGVPVVCGMGPGLPHDSVRAARSAVRQGAARAVAARMVHAPQRRRFRRTSLHSPT